MSFEKIRKLPSYEEIINLMPLSESLRKLKAERDFEIQKVVKGEGNKFLVIIGPCSADDEEAVCDYISRLAKVQDKVSDKLILIPRIYTNKPRTTGEGYKGMLHQPVPEEAPNMLEGILSLRRMHLRAISESGLTSANEMLYTDNLIYCEDVLSYIVIGARSVEDQQHRLISSGIDLPVGMKNPTGGDLTVMYNSINASQLSHNCIYQGYEVKTSGNPLTHAILRGAVNKCGRYIPNYHFEELMFASEMYLKKGLLNPMIIVDTNHANSHKLHYEQPRIAKDVLNSRKYNLTLGKLIRGLMIESYIVPGSQSITERKADHIYGKSITDACLGWDESEELIYYIAENVN